MGYLKIHCQHCGGAWEVYHHQVADDLSRQCPHCFSEIERQTWENQIVSGFGQMDDANRELFKDFTGWHRPQFRVDYISTNIKGGK